MESCAEPNRVLSVVRDFCDSLIFKGLVHSGELKIKVSDLLTSMLQKGSVPTANNTAPPFRFSCHAVLLSAGVSFVIEKDFFIAGLKY